MVLGGVLNRSCDIGRFTKPCIHAFNICHFASTPLKYHPARLSGDYNTLKPVVGLFGKPSADTLTAEIR